MACFKQGQIKFTERMLHYPFITVTSSKVFLSSIIDSIRGDAVLLRFSFVNKKTILNRHPDP